MSNISSQDLANLSLSAMELFTGIVFFYFNCRYIFAFRSNMDPFTFCSFSLVILSVLTKTIPRLLFYSLSVYIRNQSHFLDNTFLWFYAHLDGLLCMDQCSLTVPNCLLTMALIINTTRWLLLARILRANSPFMNNRIPNTLKFIMVLLIFIVILVTVERSHTGCNLESSDDYYK